jgi:hypothetical protein
VCFITLIICFIELLDTFPGHRDAITGLAFRRNTHQVTTNEFVVVVVHVFHLQHI